jgi:hypothetical protein
MSLRENELRHSKHAQRQHHKKKLRQRKKAPRETLPPIPPIVSDDQVLTFPQWCAVNTLGLRTGRRVISGPNGPIVTEMSANRIGITVGNNRAWQNSRARG